MGCHFLLQSIFLTQELNPGLLHCWQTLLPSEPNLQPIQTGYGKKCVHVCYFWKNNKQFETCFVLILILSTTENSQTQWNNNYKFTSRREVVSRIKNMLIIPRYFVIFAPGMKERGVILTTPTVEFAQGGAERFRKFPSPIGLAFSTVTAKIGKRRESIKITSWWLNDSLVFPNKWWQHSAVCEAKPCHESKEIIMHCMQLQIQREKEKRKRKCWNGIFGKKKWHSCKRKCRCGAATHTMIVIKWRQRQSGRALKIICCRNKLLQECESC